MISRFLNSKSNPWLAVLKGLEKSKDRPIEGRTMSHEDIRGQVLDLMNQKNQIENEIRNLTSILEQNGVGMNDPLVDSEGFPINSIDVYQVRNARHRIICLQNDHKNIMNQIENGLHGYYSNSATTGTCQAIPMDTDVSNVVLKTPFAKVTVVSEGSPADYAGIKANDEVVEFGSVNANNFKSITDIATVVQHSDGTQVNVKLKRGDRFLTVQLTPKKWRGRGLLGCNIVSL
ncbi:26S proteasome non-ATPase regulatory subunit 9 isoform X2 [Leptinotarsa decemlineata]|uniref:26S proteasome non-ATPase regulatory subunit 9 isoform X2 n=1 Tax=Leptinotarsa decemlineata TaxID=7539 RepID=UPI003D30704C